MAKRKNPVRKSTRGKSVGAPGKRAPATRLFPIVGIGASAGGFEAITELLSKMPADPGVAIVFVQHLDPTHESALASLLGRVTPMPVHEARNKTVIEPNHVYIVPPNRALKVVGRQVELSPLRAGKTAMVIDDFLCSLAESEGNRAIGVILSGNGSDGTTGCQAIKAGGGITFAQTEKTAKFPLMPGNAITAGCIDFVLAPAAIATELAAIARHRVIAPTSDEEDAGLTNQKLMEEIFAILRQQVGVDFTHYKPATLRRRIQRRLVLHKLDTLKDYVELLRAQKNEVRELFGDLLIHVTGFFRDAHVFTALKKRVFPKFTKGRLADHPIRIWIPGCSTGEEVYSLAIALLEYMEEKKVHHPVQIFGTDINDAALDRARAGIYQGNIKNEVSPERLRRFFQTMEGGFRINKLVREMCIFARQNLVSDPPFSNLDMVSCRNVLIYLGPTLQRKVFPVFHYSLRQNGFLVLGSSETVGAHADLFMLLDSKNKIYGKKGERTRPLVSFGHTMPDQQVAEGLAALPQTHAPPNLSEIQKQADRFVIAHFAPAGVIINPNLEVLQFRGKTGPFLEHAHGEASLSLLKMAREGLGSDLRNAVTQAIRRNIRVRHEHIRVRQNGGFHEVNVEVVPFSVPPSEDRFYLVLFENAPEAPAPVSAKKATGKRVATVEKQVREETARLSDELAATRESLQAIIEEQEATNEELRSANEEIMSSNEELQSTNEELETAKEELQSTNEELTTLNDELESRNTELDQVNNDLRNLLTSANIPIVIMSAGLRIRRFTTVAEKLLNLIPTDVGRPLTDIKLKVEIPNLAQLVHEVIESLQTREFEVQDTDGRWWSARIRPYKTTDNKIDGAVLALVDIDLLKRTMLEAQTRSRRVEAVLNQAAEPVLLLDRELKVTTVNQPFCRLFKVKPKEVVGESLFKISDGQWDIAELRQLLEGLLAREVSLLNYELEHRFDGAARGTWRINARRLAFSEEEGQTILIALADGRTGG